MTQKKDIILALISGILLVLGFPPFDLYPVAWIALFPLLLTLHGKNARISFLLGFASGGVYFLGTVYWVTHSIHVYGHLPVLVSLLILVLLCLYLAFYIGVFSMLFSFLYRNSRIPALFIVPVLWVTLEFLRTYALTGFPWSVLGYSQYRFLSLIQIADITGVYGISFLVAAFSGVACDAFFYWSNRSGTMPPFSRWSLITSFTVYTVLVVITLFYGMQKLQDKNSAEKTTISVVQGNIEQDKKWDARFQREVIDTYKRLTMKARSENPDIIVWPESALPFVFGNDTVLTREIVAFHEQIGSYLLFGSVLVKEGDSEKTKLSNSAVLLSPDSDEILVYDKIHLVPYGEYVPLGEVFPFIEKLVVAVGDFVPGRETRVMNTPVARIGNLICYEIIFPGLVRKSADKGANLFVTITNDAWFGRTSAPYQHFSMAAFRAIENRVPVARAANTGISGFIDSRGRIMKKSSLFVEAVLTEEISLGVRKSFYTRHGDLFAFFSITSSVLLLIGKFVAGRQGIKRGKPGTSR